MRKILLHAGMSPMHSLSAYDILCQNTIGNNTGNILFANSVFRALMTEDAQIDCVYAMSDLNSDAFADKVNAEYECFIMPLASAFRPDYMPRLRALTRFVERLRIPCVLIGAGVQARSKDEGMDIAKDVRAFLSAVLDRSSRLGLRGSVTAEYVTKLGFCEGRDFTVIGCPSMFLFGGDLPECRVPPASRDARISVNAAWNLPEASHAFIREALNSFPDHYFVAQTIAELRSMYFRMPNSPVVRRDAADYYPLNRSRSIAREDREIGFLSVSSWLAHMRRCDLSLGTRIHGNIVAALAGTPALIVAEDLRIRELAEYFEIPLVPRDSLHADLLELCAKTDFTRTRKHHARRFEVFRGFLDGNGLRHVYMNGSPAQTPYDGAIAALSQPGAITRGTSAPPMEKLRFFALQFPKLVRAKLK